MTQWPYPEYRGMQYIFLFMYPIDKWWLKISKIGIDIGFSKFREIISCTSIKQTTFLGEEKYKICFTWWLWWIEQQKLPIFHCFHSRKVVQNIHCEPVFGFTIVYGLWSFIAMYKNCRCSHWNLRNLPYFCMIYIL